MGMHEEQVMLSPEEAFDDLRLGEILSERARQSGFAHYRLLKRSIDARKRPVVHIRVEYTDEPVKRSWEPAFPDNKKGKRVKLILCCNYFCRTDCIHWLCRLSVYQ